MELRAVKNVVKTINNILDALEEKDKTGTVSFILKWFGLGLRYSLTLAPLLHMNIMGVIWEISKRLCNYDDENPSKLHLTIRTISYLWIPSTSIAAYVICAVQNNWIDPFTDDIIFYMFWFSWSLCIPILWLVDIISGPKVDFNKSALKILNVKNVKLTVDAVLHNTRDGREFTFLWVTSLISIFPAFLIGFFSHYIYDEFINIGNSRSLKCEKIDFSKSRAADELETYSYCLNYFDSYNNGTVITTDFEYNTNGTRIINDSRICCLVSSISSATFLQAIVYFISLFFFSRVFAKFIAEFVLRSEQVQHKNKFKEALKAQLNRVKTSVNETLFRDNPINDDGSGGIKKIEKLEHEDSSDEEDEWEINTQSSNLDDLDHDMTKIERKCQRRRDKMKMANDVNDMNDLNELGVSPELQDRQSSNMEAKMERVGSTPASDDEEEEKDDKIAGAS